MASEHQIINKVKQAGTTERKTESGRLQFATTEENKQYFVKEFPCKRWKVASEHQIINKVKQAGTTERKTESGRLQFATTEENKQYFEDMNTSQEEECSGTHKSQ